jgi:pilus assembly protein CpaE
VGLIHEDHLQRVIGLLRASYSHLLIDLSKRMTPTDLAALRMADIILLVAQLELSSLRNAVRLMMTMGAEEGISEKIRVVLNRVGCDFYDGAINLKKAEETIGKPAYWQLPNDAKAMMGSRNAGVPLVQFAPRSRVNQSITALAEALCGNSEPEVKKKSGFFSHK